MSDQNSKVIDPEAPELHLPSRSLLKAYALLLPGIFIGVHRFYVGKWRTGLLYLPGLFLVLLVADILSDEWAFEFIGLIYLTVFFGDGWFLRRWVSEFNQKIVTDYEKYPERYQIEDAEHIAPWARGRAKKVKLGFIASRIRWLRNYVFFLILPALNGWAASEYESVELLMIPIVILIIIGLIGSLDKTLSRYPTIQEIPGVGQALGRVDAMRKLYWEKEPNVMGAFKGLFLRAGKEYKPYWGIASIVFATVIISGLMSWEVNSASIEPYVAAEIVVFTALFAAAVILVNLVPVTALSFHYSLSGKTTRLGFMTLLAIIATVSGYAGDKKFSSDGSGSIPTFLSATRLDERMKNPDYKKLLKEKMSFFLGYYMEQKTKEPELQKVFSDLISKLAPNDESKAFGVYFEQDKWLAIVRHHSGAKCLISDETGIRKIRYRKIQSDEDKKRAFSVLAVAYKPTKESDEAYIKRLIDEGKKSPLEMIKLIDKKILYYSWIDVKSFKKSISFFVPDKECQKLIDD